MRFANVQGLALAAGVLAIEIAVVAYGLSLDALTPPTSLLSSTDALAPLTPPVAPGSNGGSAPWVIAAITGAGVMLAGATIWRRRRRRT